MAYVRRSQREAQVRRMFVLSIMLLTLSLLAFGVSAWFYTAVQQQTNPQYAQDDVDPNAGRKAAGAPAPHRSNDGPLVQDQHRFSLGPGQAPPVVTPVDPQMMWITVGVFIASNVTLILLLGTGAPARRTAA